MSYLPSTSTGRSLVNAASASAGRTVLGLGTIATQDSNNVSITGGSISGITLIGLEDIRTVSADLTLDANDKVVAVTASSLVTITLIAASGSGRCYVIKSTPNSAANVVIEGGGSDTIDGALNYTLSTPGESITVVDIETGKWIIV